MPRVQGDKHTRPPVFLRHQHGMLSSGPSVPPTDHSTCRAGAHAGQRDVDSAVDCVGFEARGAGKAAAGEVPAQVGLQARLSVYATNDRYVPCSTPRVRRSK